jgi:hypothetical protein
MRCALSLGFADSFYDLPLSFLANTLTPVSTVRGPRVTSSRTTQQTQGLALALGRANWHGVHVIDAIAAR